MAEPITLTEAKAQCRMADDNSEDTFITSLIAPARAYVERATRYAFVGEERTEAFPAFGDYLELWRKPIASIGSITYSVSDDPLDDVAYEGFVTNLSAFPVRIYPALGGTGFPDLEDGQSVTVVYTTGAIPATSEEYLVGKRAMLLLIGYWFDNRGEVPLTKEAKLAFDSILDELRPVSAY